MRRPGLLLAVAIAGCLATGCAPGTLRRSWLIGVEQVGQDDPRLPSPTDQLIATLAGLPNVMVVDLRAPGPAHDFASLADGKLRLATRTETGAICLRASYAVFRGGRLLYTSGLVIPHGDATRRAGCIALFATRLYGDLVRQGL